MKGNFDKSSKSSQPLKIIFTEGKNDVAFFGYLIRRKMNFDKDSIYTIFEKKEKKGSYIGNLIRKINENPLFFVNKLIIFGDSGVTVLIRKILPHFIKDVILKKWSDIRIILIIDRDYRTEKADEKFIEKIPNNLKETIEKSFGCKCQIKNATIFDVAKYIISIYIRGNIECRLCISIFSIREELEKQVEYAIKERIKQSRFEDVDIRAFFKRMLIILENYMTVSKEEPIDSIFNTVYESCNLDRFIKLIKHNFQIL